MRHGASYLWSEGQWAALALIASSLVGHLLPDAPAFLVDALPPWLTLMLGFPLIVMVPVLLAAGARASWRARSIWTGFAVGSFVAGVTAFIVMAMYVVGLALGQPQLLRIGLGWESLRDATLIVATTTGVGAALSAAGALAGGLASLARGRSDMSLSRSPRQ
jgi:hypothetical protein